MSDDRRHLEAWADTGDGYYFADKTRGRIVLQCLWCEYQATGRTQREAIETYRRDHEQPILDRRRAKVEAGRGVQ